MPYLLNNINRQYGLWPMGRPRVPPLPQAIIMTDRSNGTLYMLGQTGSPGSLVFTLTTSLWQHPDRVIFGPEEGPYLPLEDRSVRLYINGGNFLGEFYDPPYLQSPRVLTRRAWQRRLLEVTAPAGWKPGDQFNLTEVQL